jgi:hypothetical protein
MIKDVYAKVSDSEIIKKDKVILSDDAYAVCDFLDKLIDKIEHQRLSSIR